MVALVRFVLDGGRGRQAEPGLVVDRGMERDPRCGLPERRLRRTRSDRRFTATRVLDSTHRQSRLVVSNP